LKFHKSEASKPHFTTYSNYIFNLLWDFCRVKSLEENDPFTLRLPPAPKKVKVADCAPRFAEQTTEAEWFVQDDLPTVYYISVSL